MTFTDNEKKLSIRLHELLEAKGQLPEIREGDWVLDDKYQLLPTLIGDDAPLYQRTKTGRSRYVLLPSWERCRELLRERGWTISILQEYPFEKSVWCNFYNNKKRLSKIGEGQTDLEAILAVMVQGAEEEK